MKYTKKIRPKRNLIACLLLKKNVKNLDLPDADANAKTKFEE